MLSRFFKSALIAADIEHFFSMISSDDNGFPARSDYDADDRAGAGHIIRYDATSASFRLPIQPLQPAYLASEELHNFSMPLQHFCAISPRRAFRCFTDARQDGET